MAPPAVVPVRLLVNRMQRRQQCFASYRARAVDDYHVVPTGWNGEPTLCHCLRWVWRHHTLYVGSRERLSRSPRRPHFGCHNRYYHRHTDSHRDDHPDIQIRRFVVTGTDCTKIADDYDHYDPAATDDYDLIAPGGGCEPALPSHNLAGNGGNPTLYVVGKPRVAERIAVQCSFAGHD